MAEVGLKAEVRNERGKNAARRLRASGKVPGVLYGLGVDALALTVDARALAQTLSTEAGRNVLIDLQVEGKTHLTLARLLDKDPIRGTIKHVDFLRVDRDQVITVDVPLHFEGDSLGLREGGVLEHHLWTLRLECKPNDVPDNITLDVSALKIGDSLHVSDIVAPEGVTILSPLDEIVVACIVPQVMEVTPPEEVPVPVEGEAAPGEEGAAEAGTGESAS